MNEAQMWGVLKKAFTKADPDCDLTRIENVASEGVPDVHCCVWGIEFWLEMKSIAAWPKRPGSPVQIRHFTPQQRLWIRRRSKAGGRVMVVVRVGPGEWLWFNAHEASAYVGKVARTRLLEVCGLYLPDPVPDISQLRFLLLSRIVLETEIPERSGENVGGSFPFSGPPRIVR